MKAQFIADIDKGLSQSNKSIPSKYFYDKRGDELFIKIMTLPEYYLTRAEADIFINQTESLINELQLEKNQPYEIIELGAGDGSKTKHLLDLMLKQEFDFCYLPIDISPNVLDVLQKSLLKHIPNLAIKPQHGDYFHILHTLKNDQVAKIVLFLGSNIGNLSDQQASEFFLKLDEQLNHGDKVLLGVDLIKPADIVLPAYDDAAGITREFNLNLLKRINNELEANFDLDAFDHAPEYDEKTGIAQSYLLSLKEQTVVIKAINKSYHFQQNEKIHVEISRKYNLDILRKILLPTQFKIQSMLTDQENYFANFILEKTNTE